MSPGITYTVALLLVAVELLAILDLIRLRSTRRFVLQTAAVAGAVLLLYLTTGFPVPRGRQAFGMGYPVELAVVVMLVGVVLGMAAHYVFHQHEGFSWRDFARPFVVSPIVLLPLIGTLEGGGLEPVQLVCLVFLAFQNGFFWQQVLRDAKPQTA